MTAKFYVNGRYFFTKSKVKRPFKGEKVLIDEEKYEVFEVTHDFDHGIFLIDLIKEETEAPEEEEGELYTSSYAGDDPVFEQLVITNQLLTYSLAVNLVVYFLIIAFFVIRFLRSIITKIFI